MREIEFRAKSKFDKNKKWVYGDLIQGENAYISTKEEFYSAVVSLGGHLSTFVELVDKETIGQYTGLKDKNGTKIFEGDIVKLTRTNMYAPSASFNGKDLVSLHRVCWNDEKHCFYQEHFDIEKKRVTGAGILCFEDERAKENIIEVVGNIHDNPELVGKVEE